MFNARKVIGFLLKVALVFAVSAGIWVLFWFHDRLYQYGLVSLTIVGGLGVAALIYGISWLTRTDLPFWRKCKFSMYFPKDDTVGVMLGAISLAAIPVEEERPPRIGTVCNARALDHSHQPFAHLRIGNIERRIIGDLDDSELTRMGFDDLESFCRSFDDSGVLLSTEDEVSLIDFDILDKRRF